MVRKIIEVFLALFVGAICASLMLITVPKIHSMLQIKGWIPGAAVTSVAITAKWHQAADESGDGREAFFIAWNDADIHLPGPQRTNTFDDQWHLMKVGDMIEIIRVPGDSTPYLRNDIYVSPGNFAVDLGLLAVEMAGIAFFLRVTWNLIRERMRRAPG